MNSTFKMKLQLIMLCLVFSNLAWGQDFEVYEGDTINRVDAMQQKQGEWVIFNSARTKILEKGQYKDGKKTGIWTTYYVDGGKQSEIEFKNGEPNGYTRIYYKNGNLSEEGIWNGDRWTGQYKFYYKNGELAYKWNYNKKGQRTGKQFYFHANGKVKMVGNWQDGKKQGDLISYNENGELLAVEEFADGSKTGNKPVNEYENVQQEYKTKEKKQEIKSQGVFDGNGKHTLYNAQEQPIRKGEFRNGRLVNGERYIYNPEGKHIRTIIIQNGSVLRVENH